jgi:hypothetical protein
VPSAKEPLADRILSFAGTDDPGRLDEKFLAFRRILMLGIAADLWYAHGSEWDPVWMSPTFFGLPYWTLPATFSVCCIAAWLRRPARAAVVLGAVVVAIKFAWQFPMNANHDFLEFVSILFLVLCNPVLPEEKRLVLAALRWVVLIVLFSAGLQKVLYGYYFGGEFLAMAVAVDPRFGGLFALLVPGDELVRLTSLQIAPSAGPYRVDSPLFVLASNLTYLAELALPILLVIRRTRPLAVAATIAFIVLIELGPRELFFGAIMINLTLLFAHGDLNRKVLPAFVFLYLLLIAMIYGVVPSLPFS